MIFVFRCLQLQEQSTKLKVKVLANYKAQSSQDLALTVNDTL